MERDEMKMALGRKKAQLVFKNAIIADVFTGRFRQADVAVCGERIVGVGSYAGETEVDLTGKYLIPGLVDAHMHFESSLVSPRLFLEKILPCGTVTVMVGLSGLSVSTVSPPCATGAETMTWLLQSGVSGVPSAFSS